MDLVTASGRDKKKLVQLALDRDKAKPVFPMLFSEKLDGCYCIAWMDDEGNVGIFSRTGERYVSMKHIEEAFEGCMVENELIIFEAYAEGVHQSTISGWCRDTKEQHTELSAYCHDHITMDEFTGKATVRRTYSERYEKLWDIIENVSRENWDIVRLMRQDTVFNMEEALGLAEVIWAGGGEGVILRNPDGLYGGPDGKCFGTKRSSDIIKIKQGISFDLTVKGVYEGTGKYTGNLGGLECAWKDGATINISGMTDEQRKMWWDSPETIIGKVVQVDAMCLSSKGLLREPRFKGVRTDKTEGDY